MSKEERIQVAQQFRELNELLEELSNITLRVHEAAQNAVDAGHTIIEALQEGI